MVRKLRTAVLVVHGMGSQRPLETVRGVINAVWFDDDDHLKDTKHKLWSHPEPSGVDLDLTVMTTNPIPGSADGRVADFHELYWAHQLSETRAVAVLLWLLELGRRGPHFKTGMNGLWWCGAVFLSLLLLSTSLLVLQAVIWASGIAANPYDILIVLALMLFVAVLASLVAAAFYRYFILATFLSGLLVIMILVAKFTGGSLNGDSHPALVLWTNALFAPALAFVAASIFMKSWGWVVLAVTYALSLGFFAIYLYIVHHALSWSVVVAAVQDHQAPWGLTSQWSDVAAWTIILFYLAANAAFLQPYLGDAARYFRNSPANVAARRAIRRDAVDTLDQLHRCRDYDRIIVVAHSLGTAVAYDMLRAYYSRICSQIPTRFLDPEFSLVDRDALDCAALRKAGRALIAKLASRSALLQDHVREGPYRPAESEDVDAWLVTDFITLGSPLTHAKYLMTNESDGRKLEKSFADAVREREFPTSPPQLLDGDGRIAFTGPDSGSPRFHHGGMFAMTRWTNLYFPVTNIFWGDAIGGPVEGVFGGCMIDRKVCTKQSGGVAFFSHVAYWKTDCRPDRRAAPHLKGLIESLDLGDKDKPALPTVVQPVPQPSAAKP